MGLVTGVHLSKVIRRHCLTFKESSLPFWEENRSVTSREEQVQRLGGGRGLGLCQGGESRESEEGHQ